MTVDDLAEGYMQFRENLYSLKSVFSRLLGQVSRHPIAYLGLNMAFRQTTTQLKAHYNRYFKWLYENGDRISLNGSDRKDEAPIGPEDILLS
jgi:hypothetical protein